jgi:hypothetical protein
MLDMLMCMNVGQLNTRPVEHEYGSINQLKGSVSQQHAIDPSA